MTMLVTIGRNVKLLFDVSIWWMGLIGSAAKLNGNVDINSYQEGSRIRSSVKMHKNFL